MRLRRSDCLAPGIARRRRGRGFSYQWPDRTPVSDPDVLDRIAALVIPPAWNDVWICPWPHGHIQATGIDSAGRRQYRYHDAWRVMRDKEKFERSLEFGRALPMLRDTVERDLALEGASRDRVLAGAVRLLDLGFFRIGGEQYAQENETFGIATLRREHVSLHRGTMIFDYPAKGSIQRVVEVTDPATYELIRMLRRRRASSQTLLAYKQAGRWSDAKPDEVNGYIREAARGSYSAKDFRTWSGTVLGAMALARASDQEMRTKTARQRMSRSAVKEVSEYLGNTPAVCRRSYIDPKIFDRFDHGETVAAAVQKVGGPPDVGDRLKREVVERAVIDLIALDLRDEAAA